MIHHPQLAKIHSAKPDVARPSWPCAWAGCRRYGSSARRLAARARVQFLMGAMLLALGIAATSASRTLLAEAESKGEQAEQPSPQKTEQKTLPAPGQSDPSSPQAQSGQASRSGQPSQAGASAEQKPQPTPAQQAPAQTPPPASPATPAPQAASGAPAPISFHLENADLLQVINLIATQLRLNYIVDPAVKGTVNINTTGELRSEDLLPILQTILRINGATAVQTGNFYRIEPLAQAAKTPLGVYSDATGKTLPSDDRMMMQIIPMRFVSAADMAKMLSPFLSEGGTAAVHEGGNILILVDNSLNVKRLMEVLAEFDSPAFATERVRLVPVSNNVASGLIPELESIFAAYAMSEKNSPVRFVPIDRINAILVVTPDPSTFEEVQKWVQKLDLPAAPSGIQTFIYRVQNSEAAYLARLLTTIRNEPPAGSSTAAAGAAGAGASASGATRQSSDGATGAAAGFEGGSSPLFGPRVRIIADDTNNALIIQATQQQYSEIVKTLKDLDVVPRQVLIEARVYEVTLTGDLSFGLSYFFQQRSKQDKNPLVSFSASSALQASGGTLIGNTREFIAFLNSSENRSRVRVLSAPSVLATDNTDAKIQVGTEVPILTSTGVLSGTQIGGTTVLGNTIQERDTGIILTVTPRITSTGLVSLKLDQEITNVIPGPPGTIGSSPSFSKRSIAARPLVQDGETIALGGLISTTVSTTKNRVPLLGDIPYVGALFGSTDYATSKTELVVLVTPHIVKDVQGTRDAARELLDRLPDLRRTFRTDKSVNPEANPPQKHQKSASENAKGGL